MSEENTAAEQDDKPSYEDLASKEGWTDKDTWTEKGNDPEEWKSARNFVKAGETIAANKKLHADMTTIKDQFTNFIATTEADKSETNKLHAQQLLTQHRELSAKRDTLIEEGDLAKVKVLDKEINNTAAQYNQANQPVQNTQETNKDKIAGDYMAANPWVMENNAKGFHARGILNNNLNQGIDLTTALKAMEEEIKKEHPEVNPNRDKPSITQRSSGNSRSQGSLAWKDLSKSEVDIYTSFIYNNRMTPEQKDKSKKEWLSSVKADREAQNNG